MLRKNEDIEVEITDITNEGNGVGRYDGVAVFVSGTAVGDVIKCRIVKVNKSYCYGIITGFLKKSAYRIDDDCAVSKTCGGCSFRHFTYEQECELKNNFVKASFERIGKLHPVYEDFVGCDRISHYRNKAQYPVGVLDGKAVCGFYAKRSHRICPQTHCSLQPECFADIVDFVMEYVNRNNIQAYDEQTGKGLLRHIYLRRGEHSDEIMLCLVVTSIHRSLCFDGLISAVTERFTEIKSIVLNENPDNTNIILGKKTVTVFGSDTINDKMCGNVVAISPQSFYQVNTLQAEKLYTIAKQYAQLDNDSVLLDLYCGAGTIGLSMCIGIKKLIGVEIIPQAIENAKINARHNGIDNAEFICGDAGKIAKILYERGERPNVIVADPARKGCDRQSLEYMAKMQPDRIVMISCNHATAARDCAILAELGYNPVKVRGVDLFPRTTHVECVVLLTKSDIGICGGRI